MTLEILSEKTIKIDANVCAFNFTGLCESELRQVLLWRTDKNTSQHSKTKNISWKQHLEFVETLKSSHEQACWVIKHKLEPVAVCSLFQIQAESATSGNYIIPGMTGYGVLANLVIHEIAFNRLGLQLLYGEIAPGNHAALRLAKLFKVELSPADNGYIKVTHRREDWLQESALSAKLMNAFR